MHRQALSLFIKALIIGVALNLGIQYSAGLTASTVDRNPITATPRTGVVQFNR